MTGVLTQTADAQRALRQQASALLGDVKFDGAEVESKGAIANVITRSRAGG